MLWKGVKMPGFVRFLAFFKTAIFAVVLTFCVSNVYAGTSCPSGYVPQTNVFQQYLEDCPDPTGISNVSSFSQTSTAISDGGGDWLSYFQDFRVKGRAYCSTTAPTTPADTNAPCAGWYKNRPMATSINTTTPGGTHCWCQATEHQRFSTVSKSWAAPFQRIYTNYVYLKDMGESCEDSCAAYCSYMGTHVTVLETPQATRFMSENLRATIYNSLLECIPIENKITYINRTDNDEWDIIDYDYYNGSVTFKQPPQKANHVFKGWCETEYCKNPFQAGNSITGWSGAKTLYAQWERTGCETGVKMAADGTCTDECEDGYEPQLNPFYAKYSGYRYDLEICEADGSYHTLSGTDWYASFMSAGFAVSGHSYCSTTAPTPTSAVDTACAKIPMVPMAETIDTENEGQYCWCQVSEFEQQYQRNALLPAGHYPLESKYVYAGIPQNGCWRCPALCSGIIGKTWDTLKLRVTMYRSPKKCVKSKYTLILRDGDTIINTISNYTVTDTITLPTPAPTADKIGYEFAGWCEDLNNCDEPLTNQQSGLSGNKTLYAKWTPVVYSIDYVPEPGLVLSKSMPTVFTATIDEPYPLTTPADAGDDIAYVYYDESGSQIEYLSAPVEVSLEPSQNPSEPTSINTSRSVTVNVKSVSRAASGGSQSSSGGYSSTIVYTPSQTCDAGYDTNTNTLAELDPKIQSKTNRDNFAYVSNDVQAKKQYGLLERIQWLNDDTPDPELQGVWGALFEDASVKIYGLSSCRNLPGETAYDNMKYSEESFTQRDTDGANCWCKMTDYTLNNGQQTNTTDTPWVYLKKFEYTNNQNDLTNSCTTTCVKDCVTALRGNQFFRTQLFGEYSTCNVRIYNISYELNGGTWEEGIEVPYHYTILYQDVEIPNTVTKANFTFDGWCTDSNPLSTSCSTSKIIRTGSLSSDITFYARWKTNISFAAGTDDATGSINNLSVYYNQENIQLPQNAFSRNGYEFDGWNCVVNGQENPIQLNQPTPSTYTIPKYNYDAGMTCTVNWRPITYHIYIQNHDNKNNSSQAWYTAQQPLTFTIESEDKTIPAAESASPQYDFTGWCVGETDNCSATDLVEYYTIPQGTIGDVTLWAHWEPATYEITYYLDDENYGSDPQVSLTEQEIANLGLPTEYTYGETTVLRDLANDDMKAGYNFIGWDVYDENGNLLSNIPVKSVGALYNENDENKIYIQPIVLVGQWEPIVYTIKYYKQSTDHNAVADNHYQTQTFTVETASITLAEGPTLEHFEFNGWYDFEDNQLVEEINPIPGKDWYLYAQWIRISCEDGNYLPERGGTCHSCSNDYPQANGATSIDDCYALCPTQIANCPANSNCEYDYTVADDEHPNRDYYHTNISGEAMPSCSFTFTCNPNYHKNNDETGCEPDTYPIIYHDGENELSDEQASSLGFPTIHTYGVDTNLPDTYDIPHYDFAGWYDNGTFEGTPVIKILGTEVPNNEQFDFYVKWDATPYHIEFLQGKAGNRTTGFTGTMPNQTTVNYGDNSDKQINYNDTVKLNTNNFDITGYDFTGWHCSVTYDNGNSYEENLADEAVIENYVFDSDMVCTAQWQAQTFELTRNCDDGELANGQDETISVAYDGSYSLDNICKPRDNYSITSWSCTNGLPSTGGTWLITNNSTCTANWGETSYNITYKDNDGTVLSNLTPATYHVSDTPLIVPTSNPEDTAYAHFKGWCVGETNNCTDEQLVSNYSIPTPNGLGTNIVMWANWEASACPAGKYLDNAQCFQCPTDTYAFTSIEENTGGLNSCYYNWSCDNDCPAHAICTFVSGQSSGTIHPGESYSCEITFECDDGYIKQSDSCTLDAYSITYHNVNDTDWATGANHPLSYTVEDSPFTISNPQNRAWEDFVGWCINENNCDTPVQPFLINPTETHADIDLYAKWEFSACPNGYDEKDTDDGKTCEPTIYTITYKDGDDVLSSGTFTVKDETISLDSAFKEGYIFDGWCVNTPTCTPNAMVKDSIDGPWMPLGNKTLYAQWTEEEFVCDSGKFLHIGDDAACLITEKPGSPAFAVGNGNKKYYLKMTEKQDGNEGLNMNEDSNKRINVLYKGTLYNVHDESVE